MLFILKNSLMRMVIEVIMASVAALQRDVTEWMYVEEQILRTLVKCFS